MIAKFYSYFRSSTAYRLRIALNLKNVIPRETIFINLKEGQQHSSDFKSVNPAGAVPAFELDDGTILTQSMSMLEWLDDTYPNPSLLPEGAIIRAKVRAFANIIACDMHPVNNLKVLNYLTSDAMGLSQQQRNEWMHHWMHQGFHTAEMMLGEPKTKFCFTDQPSLAEICLVPQIYNALRFEVEMSSYPKLLGVYKAVINLPQFDAAKPENQPDCTLK